ncbi:hypothetical protein SAMN05216564_11216 [Halopenitus persicus]|uniref:IrrE N-terminal-like domain-containing protein n=1 Tax=Halopenitus persicus TaxID=1048396 RepID=A0A1H3N9Q0_9EURY|nr:hypothetical protein SAMN05216564_11216 [Halopenitus persicus]
MTAQIVPEEDWSYGEVLGICEHTGFGDTRAVVEVRDRENDADLAQTLIHEYAHALLHSDVDDEIDRPKREVEAEAVAYIVGRYCGIDTSGSSLYLAAWISDDTEVIRDRLSRISDTAEEIISVFEEDS